MKKFLAAVLLFALVLLGNVDAEAKSAKDLITDIKSKQSQITKREKSFKAQKATSRTLISETATTRVYQYIDSYVDEETMDEYVVTTKWTYEKVGTNLWASVEIQDDYEAFYTDGTKSYFGSIEKKHVNLISEEEDDEDYCEVGDITEGENCVDYTIESIFYDRDTKNGPYTFWTSSKPVMSDKYDSWIYEVRYYHPNYKIKHIEYSNIICVSNCTTENEVYNVKTAYTRDYNTAGQLTSYKLYGMQEEKHDDEGDLVLTNPTHNEARTYYSNGKLKSISIEKRNTSGKFISGSYVKQYNASGLLTKHIKYTADKKKYTYVETRTYHSNNKIKTIKVINYSSTGVLSKSFIKGFDNKGRETLYKLFNNKSKAVYAIEKSYHKNGVVKARKRMDYDSNGKNKKFVMNTYRSNKTTLAGEIRLYNKGKIYKSTKYAFNKKGQLKSNKYGKAYRLTVKYNSKGKVTSKVKQQYNKNGKLLKK